VPFSVCLDPYARGRIPFGSFYSNIRTFDFFQGKVRITLKAMIPKPIGDFHKTREPATLVQ
jgi:hypothetical protein